MLLFICDNPDVLNVMRIVKIAITIVKIAVPIILIVSLMLTFAQAVISDDKDALNKQLKLAVNKMITAVLIFLVPTFISIIFNIVGAKRDYMSCINNATPENISLAYSKQAQTYLSIANESLNRTDFSTAKNLILNLKNEKEKTALLAQLDTLEVKIKEKEKEEKNQTVYGGEFIYPLGSYKASFTACFDGNDNVHNGSHGAVDLGAPFNTPIYASKGGKVITARNNQTSNHSSASGNCGGCGNYVIIDHQDGTKTTYCHMYPGKVFVKRGDMVSQGDLIGEVGSTGCSTGAHLHFALSVNGHAVDPVDYVSFNVSNPKRCK